MVALRDSHEYEVFATSLSWPWHTRARDLLSPSPDRLPTDSVRSVYSSYLGWAEGAGGTVTSTLMSTLAGLESPISRLIHSFTAISIELLLIGAPDTVRILCRKFIHN